MNFDPISYFRQIQAEMLALRGANRFFRASSVAHMEELISNLRKAVYPLLVIIDSNDGYVHDSGSGFWDSRYYSVFILTQVKLSDDDDHTTKMALCREIFKKILSRMIRDTSDFSNNLVYLHPDRIKYDEVGPVVDNLFGLHFGFTIENPQDLVYDAADWTT